MLPKEVRFSLRKRFIPEKTYSSLFFVAKLRKNTLSHNRYAFIVSKKIDSRATVRNRIRRLFQASVVASSISKTGYDILFIAKKNALYATREKLVDNIQKTLF